MLTTTEIDFIKDVFADFKNSESLILVTYEVVGRFATIIELIHGKILTSKDSYISGLGVSIHYFPFISFEL